MEVSEDCLFEDSSENPNLGRFLWHCSEQESNCWKLFERKTCVKSEAGRQEGEDRKFFGLFPSFFLSSPKWLLQKPFKREIVVRPRFQLSGTMNGMKRVSIAKEKPNNNQLNKRFETNVKMFWCLLGGGWQFSLKVCSCCKLSSWRGTASTLETGKFSPVSSLDRF